MPVSIGPIGSSGKYLLCSPIEGGEGEVVARFDSLRRARARLKRIKLDAPDMPIQLWVSGPIQEVLRRAIRKCRKSRYAIAKGAGLGQKVLPRFLDQGTDIQLSTIEALAEYLGLELRPKERQEQIAGPDEIGHAHS